MKEIEAKILEVDRAAVEAKLGVLGGQLMFEKEFYAVYYDAPDGSLHGSGKTIRLRKEGEQVVLTVKLKAKNQAGVKVAEEYETGVEDFGKMDQVLTSLGYVVVRKMRKMRAQYALGNAHVVIDDYKGELDFIPVFIEIEAGSKEAVVKVAEDLGYGEGDLNGMNAFELVLHYGGSF